METLLEGIRLDRVTTSMTTNAPAAMIWAMSFASRHVLRWNMISISGYRIREAGSTAAKELAFTLRDGIEYVEHGIRAGLDVDDLAPRLSFFFAIHNDFFEEIAKLRAARRIWARIMKEKSHAINPRSMLCRIHSQTAGVSLSAQQPYNNIVRVTLQALAAVLGGTQSLDTNSLDETLALPTEKAATIALRTRQIIAHESGVPNAIDPLGGSCFVETLADELESTCRDCFARIDALGGMVLAIEQGFPQREIQEASYRFQQAVERKEKIVVGVNDFDTEEHRPIDQLVIDESSASRQCENPRRLRLQRDNRRAGKTLAALGRAARGIENLLPPLLDCVRSYAALGEMCDVLRSVYGEYREPNID